MTLTTAGASHELASRCTHACTRDQACTQRNRAHVGTPGCEPQGFQLTQLMQPQGASMVALSYRAADVVPDAGPSTLSACVRGPPAVQTTSCDSPTSA
jgi:hypothetical protein